MIPHIFSISLKSGELLALSSAYKLRCGNQTLVTLAVWKDFPSCQKQLSITARLVKNWSKLFWNVSVYYSPFWLPEMNATDDSPQIKKHVQTIASSPPVCGFKNLLASFQRACRYDSLPPGPSRFSFFLSDMSNRVLSFYKSWCTL